MGKFTGVITKILVVGEEKKGADGDKDWGQARIDDGPIRNIKVTIRTFLHQGHPLEVYINGADPLYPTVVYDKDGNLIGVSAGLLGAVR